ncbi:uncharacterized protein BROUX77_001551 [Berkeleyomyces rouxiae]|uniref:uncharacterized protein n=1 Tax=Berkeleyomyces rouxiae TaxID=2035830 RepID=UPI003B814865
MFSNRQTLLAVLVAMAVPALGQVTTDCNPMEKSCPNNPALGTTHEWNFTSQPDSSMWKQKVNGVTYDPELGAKFTVSKQGDSPTLMSNFYFFWGRTEMMMRCANGTGIISSMMWLSDDLDEVDFEFMGTQPERSATNYFGKGIEDFSNGGYHNGTFNNQAGFHNYTVDWTENYLRWYIDGELIRTLTPNEANNTYNFPQTPMKFNIGIWAGGDPRLPQGTRDWAGGTTDYNAGPYSMYVKSVKITDYSNNSKEYQWSDRSGMANSIKVVNGTSAASAAINKAPEKSFSEKFNELSSGAKAGIFGGAGLVATAAVAGGLLYFCRQRKRGAAEAEAAEKAAEQSRQENSTMAAQGINPDAFNGSTGIDYNPLMQQDTNYIANSLPNTPVNPQGPLDSYGAPTMSGMAGAAMPIGAAVGVGATGGARKVSGAGPYAQPISNQVYQNDGMPSPGLNPYANNAGYTSNPQSPTGGFSHHNDNGNTVPVGGFGGSRGYERVGSPASNSGYAQSQGGYSADAASPYGAAYPSPMPPTYGGGYGQTQDSIPLQNRNPTMPHMGNNGFGYH